MCLGLHHCGITVISAVINGLLMMVMVMTRMAMIMMRKGSVDATSTLHVIFQAIILSRINNSDDA